MDKSTTDKESNNFENYTKYMRISTCRNAAFSALVIGTSELRMDPCCMWVRLAEETFITRDRTSI
jgi:hypothetical protein